MAKRPSHVNSKEVRYGGFKTLPLPHSQLVLSKEITNPYGTAASLSMRHANLSLELWLAGLLELPLESRSLLPRAANGIQDCQPLATREASEGLYFEANKVFVQPDIQQFCAAFIPERDAWIYDEPGLEESDESEADAVNDIYELLPENWSARLTNRYEAWGMLIFDCWLGLPYRQKVFVDSGTEIHVVYIAEGNLFDLLEERPRYGPIDKYLGRMMSVDASLYSEISNDAVLDWAHRISAISTDALEEALRWATGICHPPEYDEIVMAFLAKRKEEFDKNAGLLLSGIKQFRQDWGRYLSGGPWLWWY